MGQKRNPIKFSLKKRCSEIENCGKVRIDIKKEEFRLIIVRRGQKHEAVPAEHAARGFAQRRMFAEKGEDI